MSKHKDERIGRKVPESWDSIGYDDGKTYRCKDGEIVELVNTDEGAAKAAEEAAQQIEENQAYQSEVDAAVLAGATTEIPNPVGQSAPSVEAAIELMPAREQVFIDSVVADSLVREDEEDDEEEEEDQRDEDKPRERRKKRGRPRKSERAKAESKPAEPGPSDSAAAEDAPAAEPVTIEQEAPAHGPFPAPSEPVAEPDPRLGTEVEPGLNEITFPDGARYRVEDGKVVAKIDE